MDDPLKKMWLVKNNVLYEAFFEHSYLQLAFET